MKMISSMRVLSVFALVIFIFGASSSSAIVNGTIAQPGDRRTAGTVIILRKTPNGQKNCTGILIEKNMVLTAAHCFPKDMTSGQVGFIHSRTEGLAYPNLFRKIVSWQSNPKYWEEAAKVNSENLSDFDLAVAKFEGDTPEDYQPFKISPDPISVSAQFVISGLGTIQNSDKSEPILRITEYPENSLMSKADDSTLAFDGSVTGACHGDSGGPMVVNDNGAWRAVGVLSAAIPVDAKDNDVELCRGLTLITNITVQYDWVQKTMASLLRQ